MFDSGKLRYNKNIEDQYNKKKTLSTFGNILSWCKSENEWIIQIIMSKKKHIYYLYKSWKNSKEYVIEQIYFKYIVL